MDRWFMTLLLYLFFISFFESRIPLMASMVNPSTTSGDQPVWCEFVFPSVRSLHEKSQRCPASGPLPPSDILIGGEREVGPAPLPPLIVVVLSLLQCVWVCSDGLSPVSPPPMLGFYCRRPCIQRLPHRPRSWWCCHPCGSGQEPNK
jgi:hypothetical protein